MITVIKSFADKATERFWRAGRGGRIPSSLQRAALRKLVMVDDAHELQDLTAPPGNRLEALRGDRQGQHSIGINDQFRLCFVWREGNAYEVEIVDYH